MATLAGMTTSTGEENERELASVQQRHGRIPADTFAVRLMLARALAGHLSIREAAEVCGFGRGAWTNWERGARPLDIVDVCGRIAEGLDVDFNWLLLGGPLAGPRGVPTKRPSGDNGCYPATSVRPTDNRPNGRPRPSYPNPSTRRAARVGRPNQPAT